MKQLVCVACGVPLDVQASTTTFVCNCVGGVAVFPRTFVALKPPRRDLDGPIVTGVQGDY